MHRNFIRSGFPSLKYKPSSSRSSKQPGNPAPQPALRWTFCKCLEQRNQFRLSGQAKRFFCAHPAPLPLKPFRPVTKFRLNLERIDCYRQQPRLSLVRYLVIAILPEATAGDFALNASLFISFDCRRSSDTVLSGCWPCSSSR